MHTILHFMKKNYKILLLLIISAVGLWSFIPGKEKKNPQKDALLMEMIFIIIQNGHYAPAKIDNAFSEKVFDSYLEALDPNKRFFTQEEIDKLTPYKHLLDEQIQERSLLFFDLSYELLQKRLKNTKAIYYEVLSKPFDFTIDENINTNFENQAFSKDLTQLKERWRKQLKLNVLSAIDDKIKIQEGKKTNTKNDSLATTSTKKKKEEKPIEKKSFETIEKEARENALKSLDEYFSFMNDLTREEWQSVYINSILEQIDPHTTYLSPESKEKFDESMSGSMEGIGAQLRKKNDYIEITDIIAGGPAWKERSLENGDLILKVAQGTQEPTEIAGMRLSDVVKLIKGKKGTKVHLTVKKVDGTIKEITIVRDKFELEETFAKSTLVSTKEGTYGIIQLPQFYVNFKDKQNRDAYKDVKKELALLKEQNVKGIIMDLRNNGGGSLQTVVDMVGLFVEQGPVVQVSSPKGQRNILFDNNKKPLWNGPLVVLINNHSASASEIFAAAIQDYNRGLVVGSKHSFGKGTVQVLFDLNNMLRVPIKEDMGALKFTSQKFYRINGGSTQLKGVSSDIVLPDRYSHINTGERDYDTAMPWDKINKASYKTLTNDFKNIIQASNNRVKNNPNFSLIDENAQWISRTKDDSIFSLNYKKFKIEAEKTEKILDKFKALKKYKNQLNFSSLPNEVAQFKTDTLLKSKRERWHEYLVNDLYIEEAVNILKDMR